MKKLLLLALCFITISCKADNLQTEFVGKVWFVDSVRVDDALGMGLLFFNHVMMPQEDESMTPYRDQRSLFKRYKISNDTIYLEKEVTPNGYIEYKYMPYRYNKVSKYSSRLISLDKSDGYKTIYLTDLTDLFDGTVDNTNSTLYNKIKKYCWYPIDIQYKSHNLMIDTTIYSESHPKYYLKTDAFYIKDDSIFFLYAEPGDRYKFTDNTIYRIDKNNTLYKNQTFEVSFFDDISLECMKLQGALYNYDPSLIITFKKIDPYLLVDENQLSKKERFGCDEKELRERLVKFIELINKQHAGKAVYDAKTIKLIDKDEENCEFTYTYSGYIKIDGYKMPDNRKIRIFFKDDGTSDIEEFKN